MSTSDRLREQIDACRTGTGDLSLPELAELARTVKQEPAVAEKLARSQRFDGEVRAALNDVPIPTGLAERLIAAAQTNLPAADVSLPPSVERPSALARAFRTTRRHWLVAGGSLAMVALIALTAFQLLRGPRVVTQEELAGEVAGWPGKLVSKAWQPAAKLPTNILDRAVLARPLQWQRVSSASSAGWAGTVTAIDLTPPGPGMPRAILFVVKSSARFDVPTRPTTTTRLGLSGGFTATAWQRQESNLLFVLVLEGDRNQPLENYLRIGPQA